MASFFEKLKSSMGVEEEDQGEQEKEQATQKGKKKDSSAAKETEKKDEKESKAKKVEIKSTEKEEEEIFSQEESDWFEPQGELAVDVYQTDNEIIIQSTIAGVKPEDLDISIENDTITISGERTNVIEDKGKNYFYQECFWGSFSRQIILPEEVDGSKAEATMKDGVFTLRLPKIERKKANKIKVRG